MKNLLIALLIVSSPLQAASIASMNNQGGGKIVLTDERCRLAKGKFPDLYHAYFYTAEGITGDGCYTVQDDTVVVVWDIDGSGETRRYPIRNFTLTKPKSNL
jgi:hypothetical protein